METSAGNGISSDPCSAYLINRPSVYLNQGDPAMNIPPYICSKCSLLFGVIDENCEFRKRAMENMRKASVQAVGDVPLPQGGPDGEQVAQYA